MSLPSRCPSRPLPFFAHLACLLTPQLCNRFCNAMPENSDGWGCKARATPTLTRARFFLAELARQLPASETGRGPTEHFCHPALLPPPPTTTISHSAQPCPALVLRPQPYSQKSAISYGIFGRPPTALGRPYPTQKNGPFCLRQLRRPCARALAPLPPRPLQNPSATHPSLLPSCHHHPIPAATTSQHPPAPATIRQPAISQPSASQHPPAKRSQPPASRPSQPPGELPAAAAPHCLLSPCCRRQSLEMLERASPTFPMIEITDCRASTPFRLRAQPLPMPAGLLPLW
ncbi:uncharacterized protein PSFLO_05117 [Pseudozyma flocculosa]|uniref:Uncharacterized protein n=1 Tax=Pseudozyma flocculosa TaxID=84751 RepID=A0A5C3F6J0_9BASI|nr:uncharacterized protein PSFLO_05117 [Pseudozyma flocculosa]